MTSSHKIMFVVESLNVGGSETFVKDLVLGLDRTRFSPMVCCLSEKGRLAEPLEAAGIRVVVLGWRLGSFVSTLSTVARLARLMSREKVELVQTVYYRPEILAALASLLTWRPVLVASQHDVIVPEGSASRAFLRLSRLRVRHVIANCETCGLHRRALTSHRRDRVSVIHIGLRTEESGGRESVAEEALQQGDGPEGGGSGDSAPRRGAPVFRAPSLQPEVQKLFDSGPVVTYAGRLHPIKGPDVFLAAAGLIAARRPSVNFLMVGEGPMRVELAERVSALGLTGRVKLVGHVPSLTAVLKRSSVFVCSSRSEGFPTVVLEAMAAGVPVVAANVGGVPELVNDRVNGLLFERENSDQLALLVEGLLANRSTARILAARARDRVQAEFRFEDTVKQTEGSYLRLLGEKSHGEP